MSTALASEQPCKTFAPRWIDLKVLQRRAWRTCMCELGHPGRRKRGERDKICSSGQLHLRSSFAHLEFSGGDASCIVGMAAMHAALSLRSQR